MYLIGWTGCHPKHLRKYADAWERIGASTECETSHCGMGVREAWSNAKFDSLAVELLERMTNDLSTSKIVHVFSNGGGTLWTALSRLMQAHSSPVRFAALVFDSCPGSWRSLSSGFNFLWESQRAPAVRGAIALASPLIALGFGCGWLSTLRCTSAGCSDLQSRYLDDFLLYARDVHKAASTASHPLQVLFLYSYDDALIPADAVELAIRLHVDEGADVNQKSWPNSTHVQHLKTDPEGYLAELSRLLSKL